MHIADMTSYWPVSNLSFLSKTIERIVAEQLINCRRENIVIIILQYYVENRSFISFQ